MRCIACGGEMLDRGTHYECSNILCDYEEDIESREVWDLLSPQPSFIVIASTVKSSSSGY
jgi:hypothetical protein